MKSRLADSSEVLGHPSALFVLFFTEMWERFSFYGMRVLLVSFLTTVITLPDGFQGWGWSQSHAGSLFGSYASLLYITPLLGGVLADRFLGARKCVIIGALLMTFGHAAMAFETELSLLSGLLLLVLGTGFFKPSIGAMVSSIYDRMPEKKDAAFTIFYMGVNAGAFFGMMLCGYLAEKIGWAYGFGLAGIFMLLGTLQFALADRLFGTIGLPIQDSDTVSQSKEDHANQEEKHHYDSVPLNQELMNPLNPFTFRDKIFTVGLLLYGVLYLITEPLAKIKDIHLIPKEYFSSQNLLYAVCIFLFLLVTRILRYTKVTRDRMFAVGIFAVFTVFFWAAFEQGASSLVIFARDYTQRSLSGSWAMVFHVVNTLLTVVPLCILTYVLGLLAKQTSSKIVFSNIILAVSFLGLWGLSIWMLFREYQSEVTQVTVSWFSILNSFFIIAFATYFSKWWESKYNPSSAFKYAYGLLLLGVGFGFLAFGAMQIPKGVTHAGVSMIWLILAYFFHTLGELCLSPVGLSQVSRLVPVRMVSFMFGMWYLAISIGNKLAGELGGSIDEISKAYGMTNFFLIFTVVPIVAGILIMFLNPVLKKLMHGIN